MPETVDRPFLERKRKPSAEVRASVTIGREKARALYEKSFARATGRRAVEKLAPVSPFVERRKIRVVSSGPNPDSLLARVAGGD
ncbi:MAG: hypothetical protein KDE35_14250 [Geminicoccaceae bacterium]|nr:hypothetical protein [Geminicoccaceae bacterium]